MSSELSSKYYKEYLILVMSMCDITKLPLLFEHYLKILNTIMTKRNSSLLTLTYYAFDIIMGCPIIGLLYLNTQ